jgi:hypothetical protein
MALKKIDGKEESGMLQTAKAMQGCNLSLKERSIVKRPQEKKLGPFLFSLNFCVKEKTCGFVDKPQSDSTMKVPELKNPPHEHQPALINEEILANAVDIFEYLPFDFRISVAVCSVLSCLSALSEINESKRRKSNRGAKITNKADRNYGRFRSAPFNLRYTS